MSDFEERILELLEEISLKLTLAKPKVKKKVAKPKDDDISSEVKELAKYYKDLGLKAPGLTMLAKEGLEKAIDDYGFEKVKSAIRFSADTWYGNETMGDGNTGNFRNIKWFCRNIDGFMTNGKYRSSNVSVSSYSKDNKVYSPF